MNSITENLPIQIEGDAALGKTASIVYCAYRCNAPLIRLNINSSTSLNDLIGNQKISKKGDNLESKFELGILAECAYKGYWLLLDEANLQEETIYKSIIELYSFSRMKLNGQFLNSSKDSRNFNLTIQRHPNFRILMTLNPSQTYPGRKNFTKEFCSNFIQLNLKNIDEETKKKIVKGRIKLKHWDKSEKYMNFLFDDKLNCLNLSIRDYIQICDFINIYEDYESSGNVPFPLTVGLNLILNQKEFRKEIEDFIYETFTQKEKIKDYASFIENFKNFIFIPEIHEDIIHFLNFGYETKRPCLLIGPRMFGKLEIIKTWYKCRNVETFPNLEIIYLSKTSTSEDLFGSIQLINKEFKFCYGKVAEAMINGGIIVISGVQEPSSDILESLNAVLEMGKEKLLLPNGEYVSLNKNFYIICTASVSEEIEKKFTLSFESRFLKHCLKDKEIEISHPIIKNSGIKLNQSEKFSKIIRLINLEKNFKEYFSDKKEMKINSIDISSIFLNNLDKKLDLEKLTNMPILITKNDLKLNSFKNFNISKNRLKLINIVVISMGCGLLPILEGTAGVGKTAIIRELSKWLSSDNKECLIFNINKSTTIEDLLGLYKLDTNNNIVFVNGPLIEAMEKGKIILLDELNLADFDKLGELIDILRYEKFSTIQKQKKRFIYTRTSG